MSLDSIRRRAGLDSIWRRVEAEENDGAAVAVWKVSNKMAGKTERVQRLDRLEKLYQGREYEGRAPWEESGTPISEKKPKVRGGLAGEIVDVYHELMAGARRLPGFSVRGDADSEKLLERALVAGRFPGALRAAIRYGLCPGTGPIGFTFRFGWPTFSVYYPGLCVPTFAGDEPILGEALGLQPDELVRLRVLYIAEREDEDRKLCDHWIREDHETTRLLRYKPIKVRYKNAENKSDADPPDVKEWKLDPLSSVEHGWGFVPIEWLRPLGEYGTDVDGPSVLGEPDGPIASLSEEWDVEISLAGRSAKRNCAPTPVLSGFSPDLMKTFDPSKPLATMNKEASLEYVGTDGAGVEKAHEQAEIVKGRAFDRARVVRLDPTKGGEPSGEALRLKMGPTVSRVDAWTAEISGPLERLASKLLRALLIEIGELPRTKLVPTSDDLRLEATDVQGTAGGTVELEPLAEGEDSFELELPPQSPDRIADVLLEREGDDDRGEGVLDPKATRVSVAWPPAIPLTIADIERLARSLALLVQAGLLPLEDAVRELVAWGATKRTAEDLLETLDDVGTTEKKEHLERD